MMFKNYHSKEYKTDITRNIISGEIEIDPMLKDTIDAINSYGTRVVSLNCCQGGWDGYSGGHAPISYILFGVLEGYEDEVEQMVMELTLEIEMQIFRVYSASLFNYPGCDPNECMADYKIVFTNVSDKELLLNKISNFFRSKSKENIINECR